MGVTEGLDDDMINKKEVIILSKGGRGRSANDQRSDALNPNNPECNAAQDNRSNQLNPKSDAHAKSRGKEKEEK